MIEGIAADADFEAQVRNCGVKCIDQGRLEVMGVPRLLSAAPSNVVRNAARYAQEGTSAEISLERSHDGVEQEAVIPAFIDSGPGVPGSAGQPLPALLSH
jgi:K+-sensing histidine kinase KdpD